MKLALPLFTVLVEVSLLSGSQLSQLDKVSMNFSPTQGQVSSYLIHFSKLNFK